MKKILITLSLSALIAGAMAQATDSLYVVTYSTGPSWELNKAANEQPHFKEHAERLGKLRKEGIIKFGARYGDKGMIVISAASWSAAKEIIADDQALTQRLFVADIQRLNIFYAGCLETPK